jgi:violaxanthin de-epoxidase
VRAAQAAAAPAARSRPPLPRAHRRLAPARRLPLARCVTDPTCTANLLCIQTCTNRPDEADCQIDCGDKFSNDVVAEFTKCAVSEKKCVPQRQDDGSWPVPKDDALVAEWAPARYTGDWYISAGLNPAFDIFDCQLHTFSSPAPDQYVGKLQWRIKDPVAGTQFVTRYAVQEFVQDAKRPGILYNHDNEFLHYQDDWYILAAKEDAYYVVYYKGSNDAWDGYGGAVIYTREKRLPKKYYAEIDEALGKIGRRLDEFVMTDNTCKARESRLEEIENDFVYVETKVAGGIQAGGKSFLDEILKDVVAVEREIEKDVLAVEKEIEKDEQQLVGAITRFFKR